MMERGTRPHILNIDYVERLHEQFLREESSVPEEWREYFNQANGDRWENKASAPNRPVSIFHNAGTAPRTSASEQDGINQLIRAYRVRGHIIAQVHPIGATPPAPAELDPTYHGFTETDLDKQFDCETLQHPGPLSLRRLLEVLRNTYCRSIGVQYMHIDDLTVRRWLQARMEPTENRLELPREQQVRILSRLTDAVMFEEFVRKKFVGAKTFSLEGCESLIPLLDLAIEKAGAQGVKEIVLGMAHRGRLNVLGNILGKSPRKIFREFADKNPEKHEGGGDVKYHLGYSNDWTTSEGQRVHLSLCFNPSHLEFVNPVVLGRVRAKQDRVGDTARETCMALLIHGDAALAGEGISQETLNLSQLTAYTTGGTLHVVVNNQIGFTTSPGEGRSTRYATDVARMLQIPIFHVNGEDPEAVAQCLNLAMDFRKQFRRDVFIDMFGYRKLGHNETDEPSFTQPLLYQAIARREPVREAYLGHLLTHGKITREDADKIAAERRARLEAELDEARKDEPQPGEKTQGIWARSEFHGGPEADAKDVSTAVAQPQLQQLLKALTKLPPELTPHPKLVKLRETWPKMAAGEEPLDWAAGETMAYATLATQGVRIRLSGQDTRRGTFSHRHAAWHDYHGNGTYMPLQHLAPDQSPVDIFNSPLSETGVLGFEYGFSLDCPDGLVLWEAQFGDFANAGQVVIDQFIASAEDKWRRLSGLVLLLPHGFEGQGPEHSSARIERFLQLCAEDNIQIAYPTTPAQIFHLLRRQALRLWRKPLVVFTPKSLLRLPEARSPLEEFSKGQFQRVIVTAGKGKPTRLLLCTGKIFYDLEKRREADKREDITIVRLEQLYPLNIDVLKDAIGDLPENTPAVWVQEEPINMGAWSFIRLRFGERFLEKYPLSIIGRAESASPASGSAGAHKREQARIIDTAFSTGTKGDT